MGESPGANRCGASALGIETSVFRHAAVHRMEHGPVPRARGFDSRQRLRAGPRLATLRQFHLAPNRELGHHTNSRLPMIRSSGMAP